MPAAAQFAFVAPDAELVRRAATGDRDAFGTLYQKYSRMVHSLLLARVRPADATDLMQDVFVQALREIPKLREPAAFGGWLAAIARHRAIDHLRRTHPWEELLDVHPAPHPADTASSALNSILGLPEAYRETLLMRLVHGLTGPEIAALTGMTHESVRVNLSRGIRMLRAKIEETL